MKENKLTKTKYVALAALLCSALWGSAFSGVKLGYKWLGVSQSDWASQMVFAGVRFAVAGVLALIFGSISQKKLLLPKRSSVPKIAVISFFQTIMQYYFYYIGLAHTTGVKAAIIVATNVFTAIFISSLIFKSEKLTAKKIVGSLIGFSGIVLINSSGLSGVGGLNFLGDGFIFLCDIASGFSSAFMNKYSKTENPVMLSGWQFFFGGIVMWLFGALNGGSIGTMTPKALMMLLYLAMVSAVAYSVWSALLKYNPVSKVAVFGFMNPVCGVIISALILKEGEDFGIKGLVSLVLVCIGIYVVNSVSKKEK